MDLHFPRRDLRFLLLLWDQGRGYGTPETVITAHQPRRLSLRINPIFAAFLLIAFLSGIAGALLTPTLSLFLTTEVKVRPLWVGLFYTANAVAGIVVSFLLAKRSDTRGDRRRLILLCCLMAVGNCLLFAFNRD